jgi:hypothetical protein
MAKPKFDPTLEKIKRAIILFHYFCEYYPALDILTELAGWPSFRNEFNPADIQEAEAQARNRFIAHEKLTRPGITPPLVKRRPGRRRKDSPQSCEKSP